MNSDLPRPQNNSQTISQTNSEIKNEKAKAKLARIPVKIQTTPNSSRERLPKDYYINIPKASDTKKIKNLEI